MPWIGLLDGEEVIPEAVPDKTDVQCPDCGERMRPRGPMVDGRARHFFHVENVGGGDGSGGSGNGCSVAESATHRKLKSLAVSRLRREFAGHISRVGPEVELQAPESDAEKRRADAFVEFEERDEQLGSGLIVEVQYRNEGKDIRATMDDYLAQDYAVVWASEDDFQDDRCLLGKRALRSRAQDTVWPHRVARPLSTKPTAQHWISSYLHDHETYNSVVPARMPPEWHDETAQRLWDEEPWCDLFTPPKTPNHIMQAAAAPGTVADVEPKLPVSLHDDLRWRYSSWDAKFDNQYTSELQSGRGSATTIPVTLPPVDSLLLLPHCQRLVEQLRRRGVAKTVDQLEAILVLDGGMDREQFYQAVRIARDSTRVKDTGNGLTL